MSEEATTAGPTSRIEKKLDGGKQVVRIYLLDNSTKTLIVDEETTAESVCETMATKIGFRKADVASLFALYVYVNGVEDRPLSSTEKVLEQVASWEEASGKLLVFQVKLFMDSVIKSDDPKLQYLLYSQCVQHVITGKYPVNKDTAVKLAGFQCMHRFGPYDASVHKPGFITARLREFIPNPVMKAHRISSDDWESDILRHYEELPVDCNPMSDYIDVHKDLEFFGCAFFPAKQKDFAKVPKQILLGINHKGITILRLRSKECFLSFKLSEIYRWGFKPDASFYFEVKSINANGPVHEFETKEGSAISDLLTDYAMALLKELGLTAGQDEPPMDEDTAASRVQAVYRGFRLRRDLEREYAAVRIQAIYRGHIERSKFDQMIEQMESELDNDAPPGM